MVELLLRDDRVDANESVDDGTTPLYYASSYGHLKVVELLLKKEGIEIDKADREGGTALLNAVEMKHYNVVNLLLRYHSKITKATWYQLKKMGVFRRLILRHKKAEQM